MSQAEDTAEEEQYWRLTPMATKLFDAGLTATQINVVGAILQEQVAELKAVKDAALVECIEAQDIAATALAVLDVMKAEAKSPDGYYLAARRLKASHIEVWSDLNETIAELEEKTAKCARTRIRAEAAEAERDELKGAHHG